jgi:hypothetical protein
MSEEPTVTSDIFSRQRPAGYDPELLAGRRVVIAGAGSLAQPLGEALVLSGLGELVIVDGDRFEPHNRAKSSHYPHGLRDAEEAELPFKAEWVASSFARCATASGATIRYANTWVQALGADLFARADLVISCVDAIAARRYVARKALESDTPLVTGGFKANELWYEVHPAAGEPRARSCWNCGKVADGDVFSCRHYAAEAARHAVVPAIQPAATALGGFMAEAAIMALHGREPHARGVALDLRSGETIVSRLLPDPDCAARHRALPVAARVDVHPERGSAADVVAALGETRGVVRLAAPFVHEASCRACARQVTVEQPLWAWEAEPRCDGCGGPWERTDEAEEKLPPVLTPPELRATDPGWTETLATLGAAPGDELQVALPGRDLVVKLAGSAEERLPRVARDLDRRLAGATGIG